MVMRPMGTRCILNCFLESTGRQVLPPLAQVAERQGKYLASLLNKVGKEGGGHANSAQNMNLGDPFIYKHLGSMATIGKYKALVDLREKQGANGKNKIDTVVNFIQFPLLDRTTPDSVNDLSSWSRL